MERLPQPKFQRDFTIVGSNLVKKVQYDPKTYILDATLLTGERYRYRDVRPKDFAEFITAKSPGNAFTKHIKKTWYGSVRAYTKLPSK